MPVDLLIGAISGYDFDAIRCWVHSLERCGFAGKRVMLVCHGEDDLIRALRGRQFEVITHNVKTVTGGSSCLERPFENEDISAERFRLMWQYLASQSLDKYRYVISVDVRDAVFQLDPSRWLEEHLGDKLLNISSETVAYEDEEWNRASLLENFGEAVYERMRAGVVWNAGVVAGTAHSFRDLCLNVHLLLRSSKSIYSDQAALNVLLSLEPYRRVTKFGLSEEGWACHAGTLVDGAMPVNLRGKQREPAPVFDGRFVYTAGGVKYAVVHQYDRVPQWNNAITAEYGAAS